MRTAALLTLSFSFCFAGCDIPKSVGDDRMGDEAFESASTSGGDEEPSASDSAVTGASPTASGSDTAGIACEDLDLSPSDGEGGYEWGCYCDSCDLEFPDISLEAVGALEASDGELCACLCAAAACGGVEDEGGVTTGDDSGDDSGDYGSTSGGDSGDGSDTASTGGGSSDPTDTSDGSDTASTGNPGDSDSDSDSDGSGETGSAE